MKFRFCGEADCPDWILAEINTLSRLSSVKLKVLSQIVVQGITNPPVDLAKAEKLFNDSKLDSDIDLKACMACLSFIVSSTVRYNANSTALQSELQQLGLPREHSTSIKRVVDDQTAELTNHFKKQSLKVNPLQKIVAEVDEATNCINLNITTDKMDKKVTLFRHTAEALLENLIQIREKMAQLQDNPRIFGH